MLHIDRHTGLDGPSAGDAGGRINKWMMGVGTDRSDRDRYDVPVCHSQFCTYIYGIQMCIKNLVFFHLLGKPDGLYPLVGKEL
jgi:hypothetical protein